MKKKIILVMAFIFTLLAGFVSGIYFVYKKQIKFGIQQPNFQTAMVNIISENKKLGIMIDKKFPISDITITYGKICDLIAYSF